VKIRIFIESADDCSGYKTADLLTYLSWQRVQFHMIVVLTLLYLFRIATAIVIFYPLIRDRVLRTKDNDCKFLPDKNPEFVISMAFVGHHVPCVVIVVCYAVVYYEIRRLIKTRPQHFDLVLHTPRPQDILNMLTLFSAHLVYDSASTP